MSEVREKVLAMVAERAVEDGMPVVAVAEGSGVTILWSDGMPTGISIDVDDGWVHWSDEAGEQHKGDVRNPGGYGLNRSAIEFSLIEAFASLTIPEHLRERPSP